jgi:hypothetical protein
MTNKMASRVTNYVKTPVYLTDYQLRKLKSNEPCSIRIDPAKKSNHHLFLTQTQVNQLNKAKSSGTTKDVKLSKTQLSKNGGFIITIPALLAGIGAAASMAGAAGGIAKAVNDKKHNDKTESEAKRHNKEVENLLKATKAMKIGKGAYLPKKNGTGAFLARKG